MKKIQMAMRTMVITMLVVLVFAFTIVGTVNGQNKRKEQDYIRYVTEMERDYVKKMRNYLDENGYRNSGVMMTHVRESSGEFLFTISIHHKKISNLIDIERERLLQECKNIEFSVKEGDIIFHIQ